MTPDSGANVVTSSASMRLPSTRCSRTTLALSSGRVTRGCWAGAAGTASNASAVTVSMHGGRIAPSRWTGKLTHGDRNGGRLLTVDRDVETIQPRMRKRNVEHEDRAGLDLRDPSRRLREVDVAVASQDLDVLLVEQADLHLVLAHLGALALEAEHQVQARVHRGKLLHPDVLEDPQDGELAGLVHQGVVGDDGEVEMHGGARSLSRERNRRPRALPFQRQYAAALPPRLDRDRELLHGLRERLDLHVQAGRGGLAGAGRAPPSRGPGDQRLSPPARRGPPETGTSPRDP